MIPDRRAHIDTQAGSCPPYNIPPGGREIRLALTLKKKPLLLGNYHGNIPPLSQALPPPQAPPTVCTCQLVARVNQQPQFPVTVQISSTKVPAVPVGFMIWIPARSALALRLGDFHKGQPTAGRQKPPPGHCHPGLNGEELGDKDCL